MGEKPYHCTECGNLLYTVIHKKTITVRHRTHGDAFSYNFFFNCISMDPFRPDGSILLDILLLTENWQVPDDFLQLNILTPYGSKHLSKPRLHGKGGGLTVIYCDNL